MSGLIDPASLVKVVTKSGKTIFVRMSENASNRLNQCEHRRGSDNGRCLLAEEHLGFSACMPLDICDKCWALGPSTPEAGVVRLRFADDIVAKIKTQAGARFSMKVVQAMSQKHLKDAERDRFLGSVEDEGV